MDMDFPHSELASGAVFARAEHRALLAHAIARQASSATARALFSAANSDADTAVTPQQMIRARINYFANQKGRIIGASFLPAICIKSEREDENRIYQSALANRKASSLNTSEPGNGSIFELSRTA